MIPIAMIPNTVAITNNCASCHYTGRYTIFYTLHKDNENNLVFCRLLLISSRDRAGKYFTIYGILISLVT